MANPKNRTNRKLKAAKKDAEEARKKLREIQQLSQQNVESKPNQTNASEKFVNVTKFGVGGAEPETGVNVNRSPKQKWYKTKDNWDFIFRRLAEVLAIAAVIIYFFQMKANRTQAEEAINQFSVMTNQLNEMRFARNLDERAWVNVFKMDRSTNYAGQIRFVAHFKNSGKTPSKKTSAGMAHTLDPAVIAPTKYPTNSSSQLLPPGAESEVVCDFSFSESERLEILSGKKLIYVYGKIFYDDIFNTNHWSRFCYIMDPIDNRSYPAPFGNDCDEAETGNGNQ